jgi:hypothetical protein
MPRNGSQTLADIKEARLRFECTKCPRKGSYSVRRLWETRGDIMLTHFLAEITADRPLRKDPLNRAPASRGEAGLLFLFT